MKASQPASVSEGCAAFKHNAQLAQGIVGQSSTPSMHQAAAPLQVLTSGWWEEGEAPGWAWLGVTWGWKVHSRMRSASTFSASCWRERDAAAGVASCVKE